jgi:hypothetical protein
MPYMVMNTNQKVHALFAIGALSALLMTELQYMDRLTKHPQQINKALRLSLTRLLPQKQEDTECMMKENLMYLRLENHFCYT